MIVDANIAVCWCVDTALTVGARLIADRSDLRAPRFLRLEAAHSLLKYVRAGFISPRHMRDSVDLIDQAITELRDDDALLARSIELSLSCDHPVYDCLYLALALEKREGLATADRRLASVARAIGIETTLIVPE